MSRPKTGSVTDAVGENGTPFMYSRMRVPRARDTLPAMPSAMRTENSADDPGARSGRCRACRRLEQRSRRRRTPFAPLVRPGAAQPGVVLRLALRLGEPVRPRLSSPGRSGSGGRHEAAGEPEVPEQHDERDREAREEQPELRPEARRQNARAKPTDWYQIASVQRSMPTLASRMTSRTTTPIAARPSRRQMLPPEGGRAPSSGPPTGDLGSFGGRLPPEPWLLDERDRGPPGRGARPDRGGLVAASRASPSSSSRASSSSRSASSSATSSSSPPGAASSDPSRGARPSASARRRSSSRMNSSNRSPIAPHSGGRAGSRQAAGPLSVARIRESDPARTGLRAVEGLDRPSEARQDLLRELVRAAAWRRARAPSGTPARIASGQRHGPRVVVGRDERREADREPAVLLADQPGQRPGEGGSQAQERRLGRRAGGGADIAEARRRRRRRPPTGRRATSRRARRRAGPSRRRSRRSPMRTSCSRRYEGPGCGQAVGHGRRGYRRLPPQAVGGGGGAAGAGASSPALRAQPAGRRAQRALARRAASACEATGDVPCATWRPGPPGRRRGPRPARRCPAARGGSPRPAATSDLCATVSASRSARSASNWSRSISRRTASSGGASDSASSGPPSSTGYLARDERQQPAAGPARRRLRARRIASVSRVVTPSDVARVRGARPASRHRTGQVVRDRRSGRGAEHHWQRGAVPVVGSAMGAMLLDRFQPVAADSS